MANALSLLFASCSPCGRSQNRPSDVLMSLTSTWICTIAESLWISSWSCQSDSTFDSLSSLLPSPPEIYPNRASSKFTSCRIRKESGVKQWMKMFELRTSDRNIRNIYVGVYITLTVYFSVLLYVFGSCKNVILHVFFLG